MSGIRNSKTEPIDLEVYLMSYYIFCGKQNIALRGHREHSNLGESSIFNPGNFQALLMDSRDAVLSNHFARAPRNAQY